MIRVTCTNCQKTLIVKDASAGKRGRCPGCGVDIVIPSANSLSIVPPSLPDQRIVSSSIVSSASSAAAGKHGNTVVNILNRSSNSRDVVNDQTTDPNWLAAFTRDKQSPDVVRAVADKVQSILIANEELTYIAVQNKPIVNFSPDCIALTNRRFIFYRPKLLGRVDFEDCVWRELEDATLSENLIGSTIRIRTASGKTLSLDYIPKAQARAVYRIVQEIEEISLQERRDRSLEEKRAAAGNVTVQANVALPQNAAPTSGSPDSMQKLQTLMNMKEAGLITAAEYDAKKREILANM